MTIDKTISISSLIDGIPHIKQVFQAGDSLDEKEASKGAASGRKSSFIVRGLKALWVLALVGYAIYVEYLQWTIYKH